MSYLTCLLLLALWWHDACTNENIFTILVTMMLPTSSSYPSSPAGFTLIEVMIVITIVGILAAIAIPSYVQYTARVQATEATSVTSGLRSEIALWVWEHEEFPSAAAVATAGYLGRQAASIEGKYISDKQVRITAGTGMISVPFDKGIVAGKTVTMTPTINLVNSTQVISWRCGGTAIDYLPASCQ